MSFRVIWRTVGARYIFNGGRYDWWKCGLLGWRYILRPFLRPRLGAGVPIKADGRRRCPCGFTHCLLPNGYSHERPPLIKHPPNPKVFEGAWGDFFQKVPPMGFGAKPRHSSPPRGIAAPFFIANIFSTIFSSVRRFDKFCARGMIE